MDLPPFLEPLVRDSPGARLKLIAAWDGLPTESQIAILASFHDGRRVPLDLALEALESSNAYVRYLAASGVNVDDEVDSSGEGVEHSFQAQRIVRKIEADAHPLVRYCRFEGQFDSIFMDEADVDRFLALPHQARLAGLRRRGPAGRDFARIIRRGMAFGVATESETREMIQEYLSEPANTRAYEISGLDDDSGYYQHDNFNELWRLVSDVAIPVGHELVLRLPPCTADGDTVPQEVVDRMPRVLAMHLLWRNDIALDEFRRRLALSNDVDPHSTLFAAAVHRCFDLSDEEFGRLLEHDVERLNQMSEAADLRLVVLRAAEEFLGMLPEGVYQGAAERFNHTFSTRLERLSGSSKEYELRELQIYELATAMSNAESQRAENQAASPDEEQRDAEERALSALRPLVVSGNAWATYRAFFCEWRRSWDVCLPDPGLPHLSSDS